MSIREPLSPAGTLAAYARHDASIAGLYASRAAAGPARPFLSFGARTWSWGGFAVRVEATARMFAGRGVGRGDRVALMAANSDAGVLVFLALARLGAILVPVNPDFGVAEARYVLDHAGVAGVVAGAAALPVARAACGDFAASPFFVGIDGAADGAPALDELIDAAPAAPLPPGGRAADICLILYTSGTTGFPKGVMHSQENFVLAGEAFVERMHLVPDERLLCVLPLFHINALFYSLGGTLAAGASLVLAPRFSASGFWPLVARSGATEVNIIAALGHILARRPRAEFVPGHRLRKVYGAPVTAEMAAVFRDEFGVATVIEGYGMTEVPGVCNLPFEGPHRYGSMGRAARHPDPARPFAELRVVDAAGRELPDGRVGELAVRTPIVMQGYYRDPAQTAAAFRDGWFLTGDLVRRDGDGFFWFVGRQKDIIRKRGENVSGAELDRVVGAHPEVAEAAAIAVPSALGEDEILVAVVPRPGARLAERDIRAWCAARLAPAKLPRYVVFATALPHTPTHRVAKFRLRQDAALIARALDCEADASPAGGAAAPQTSTPGRCPSMQPPNPYRRPYWDTQPPLRADPYVGTRLRAPAAPLVAVPQSLSEVTGPCIGREFVRAGDNDLTNRGEGAPLGQRIVVGGRVMDENGRPVPGALVEIWQANASGRYRHRRDGWNAPLDPNFFGEGRTLTDDEGRYSFLTVRPGAYPWKNHYNAWRPAHIHFSLFGNAYATRLVTQMYFPGDELLPFDPILNSIPDEKARGRLVARFDWASTRPEYAHGFQFDIVLRGRDGTPWE